MQVRPWPIQSVRPCVVIPNLIVLLAQIYGGHYGHNNRLACRLPALLLPPGAASRTLAESFLLRIPLIHTLRCHSYCCVHY